MNPSFGVLPYPQLCLVAPPSKDLLRTWLSWAATSVLVSPCCSRGPFARRSGSLEGDPNAGSQLEGLVPPLPCPLPLTPLGLLRDSFQPTCLPSHDVATDVTFFQHKVMYAKTSLALHCLREVRTQHDTQGLG